MAGDAQINKNTSFFIDWYEIEVKGGPEFVNPWNFSVTPGLAFGRSNPRVTIADPILARSRGRVNTSPSPPGVHSDKAARCTRHCRQPTDVRAVVVGMRGGERWCPSSAIALSIINHIEAA